MLTCAPTPSPACAPDPLRLAARPAHARPRPAARGPRPGAQVWGVDVAAVLLLAGFAYLGNKNAK